MAVYPAFDVIVIGAGPAGACAAIAARQAGADVLLLDRQPPGRDKVCGDALGYETLETLARLGTHDVIRPGEKVGAYRLAWPGKADVEGAPSQPGFVVPREQFDARLLGKAVDSGAVFEQAKATAVDASGRVTLADGRVLAARTVIGADGATGVTRRTVGLPPVPAAHQAVAIRGYAPRPDNFDTLTLVWDPAPASSGRAYAWAFPTDDGRVNVGYGDLMTHQHGGKQWMKDRLAYLLAAASVPVDTSSARLSGAKLPVNSVSPVYGIGRVLLAGDAANLINAISGEGIHHACLSGSYAGAATVAPDPYAAYRQAMRARLAAHHRTMRWVGRTANAYTVTTGLLAAQDDPRLFDALIGIAIGSGHFTPTSAARIARSWAARHARSLGQRGSSK